ncbi:MAG TPA: PLDc N-terminal domain-containing protein [Actinomycetota bacterium]|nr:PLDc N-terminal domain-containing protein [Actinomycetota bacterium]
MIQLLLRAVVPIALIALFVYALVDAVRVPDDSMYQAGNKLIWVILIVLVPVLIGPAIYLIVGKPIRERPNRRPPPDDVI